LVELVRLFNLARIVCAAAAVGVFLANRDILEVSCGSLGKLGYRSGRMVTFVYVAGAVLVVVIPNFEERYWSTRVKVCDVRLGIEILLRDVTVISRLHPVPM
jgi:hypothetical protein